MPRLWLSSEPTGRFDRRGFPIYAPRSLAARIARAELRLEWYCWETHAQQAEQEAARCARETQRALDSPAFQIRLNSPQLLADQARREMAAAAAAVTARGHAEDRLDRRWEAHWLRHRAPHLPVRELWSGSGWSGGSGFTLTWRSSEAELHRMRRWSDDGPAEPPSPPAGMEGLETPARGWLRGVGRDAARGVGRHVRAAATRALRAVSFGRERRGPVPEVAGGLAETLAGPVLG